MWFVEHINNLREESSEIAQSKGTIVKIRHRISLVVRFQEHADLKEAFISVEIGIRSLQSP